MTVGPMPVPSRTPISGRASEKDGNALKFSLPKKVTSLAEPFFLNRSVSGMICLDWRLQIEAEKK
jgi:hypothetical protein